MGEKTATTGQRRTLRQLVAGNAAFQVIDGQAFVRVREAAKLANLHPMVCEMGHSLLQTVGGKGATYPLLQQTDKLNREHIAKQLKQQLRRFAKVMAPTRRLATHVVDDHASARIVCWYSERL